MLWSSRGSLEGFDKNASRGVMSASLSADQSSHRIVHSCMTHSPSRPSEAGPGCRSSSRAPQSQRFGDVKAQRAGLQAVGSVHPANTFTCHSCLSNEDKLGKKPGSSSSGISGHWSQDLPLHANIRTSLGPFSPLHATVSGVLGATERPGPLCQDPIARLPSTQPQSGHGLDCEVTQIDGKSGASAEAWCPPLSPGEHEGNSVTSQKVKVAPSAQNRRLTNRLQDAQFSRESGG